MWYHSWGDNCIGGKSWGDHSTGGISWGDNSTGGSVGVTILQVIQILLTKCCYFDTCFMHNIGGVSDRQ